MPSSECGMRGSGSNGLRRKHPPALPESLSSTSVNNNEQFKRTVLIPALLCLDTKELV